MTNAFGGKNPLGLYVPMSETEQEVLLRLVEARELQLVVHGWGAFTDPLIRVGDKRISVQWTMEFTKPSAPTFVPFLDLELLTHSRVSLFREELPLQTEVCNGVVLTLSWDISVHSLNPQVVKTLNPSIKGLTSRRIDKDSGLPTLVGNLKLSNTQKNLLPLAEGLGERK